jgi:hypothetical protein
MAKPHVFEITPAQRPQYAANVDLSPNVAEPQYAAQRVSDAKAGLEHGALVEHQGRPQGGVGAIKVVSEVAPGKRRLFRWFDL